MNKTLQIITIAKQVQVFHPVKQNLKLILSSLKKQLKLHTNITQSRRKHQNGYAINVIVTDLKSTLVKHQRVY